MVTSSASNRATRIRLQWASLIIGLVLSAIAIYDVAQGEHNTSLWISIVCWPIVAILSIVQLVRLRAER